MSGWTAGAGRRAGTNISGDPPGDLEILPVPLTDVGVQRLIAEVQAEYVVRYGGVDRTPMEPAEFDPPTGLFVLGRLGGEPVACGGWRTRTPGTAEIKRMYVSEHVRRRGLAVLVLAELERSAAAAGVREMVLETGRAQPEALAMYERCGYRPVPPFGFYQDAPLAVHLGKTLGPTPLT